MEEQFCPVSGSNLRSVAESSRKEKIKNEHSKACQAARHISIEKLQAKLEKRAVKKARCGEFSAQILLNRRRPWHSRLTKEAVQEVLLDPLEDVMNERQYRLRAYNHPHADGIVVEISWYWASTGKQKKL